jgi:hypothetical protein
MRRLADQLVAFAAVLAPVIGLQRFRRDLVVRASSFSTVPSCDIVLMKHPQQPLSVLIKSSATAYLILACVHAMAIYMEKKNLVFAAGCGWLTAADPARPHRRLAARAASASGVPGHATTGDRCAGCHRGRRQCQQLASSGPGAPNSSHPMQSHLTRGITARGVLWAGHAAHPRQMPRQLPTSIVLSGGRQCDCCRQRGWAELGQQQGGEEPLLQIVSQQA